MSKAILVTLFVFFCCVPAWTQIVESDLPPVLELFDEPARELGISKPLALAIAGVESGLSPWVLNIEGQPFKFDSKEKALEKAGEAWAAGKSFDLGLMQVNSQWLRRFGISPEAALDPLANIYFGGWLLKQEIARHGDIRAAIGAYHSPTPARASRYADQVMAALERGPQPAKSSARLSEAKPQGMVGKDLLPGSHEHKMLLRTDPLMAPAGSSMVIVSQKAGLPTPASMKAAATRPENSMKVTVKK